MSTTRPIAELDTECDWDWWLAKFRLPDGSMHSLSMCSEDPAPLNIAALQWLFDNFEVHTFNGIGYDEPMCRLALAGYRPRQLKQANDMLIKYRVPPWKLRDTFPAMPRRIDNLDHVDLQNVAPGVHLGLKMLMARMHAPMIKDLPFDPEKPMPIEMREVTDLYCGNDLHGTHLLGNTVKKRLALRRSLNARYPGIDVRSKSDAQIAEVIFRTQIGFEIPDRIVPHGYVFQYTPPAYMAFITKQMQDVLALAKSCWFPVYDVDQLKSHELDDSEFFDLDGKKIKTGVKIPPELKKLVIAMGESRYKLGIGGLHSMEKRRVVKARLGQNSLRMIDVRSYYPSMILKSGMYPSQMGEGFIRIYQEVYDGRLEHKALGQRLEALIDQHKARGDMSAADLAELIGQMETVKSDEGGEKIILNGTFGKLFSKFSKLFAPELGIWVTMTGQFSLLMLIEALEVNGIPVASANTDGVLVSCPFGKEKLCDEIVAWWEQVTGMVMETDFYKVVFSASVNSYVGEKINGKRTLKGDFKKTGVDENGTPQYDIATKAAVEYLLRGVSMEKTIRDCKNITQFISARKVKGGGLFRGEFLGKVVRWYLSNVSQDCITDSVSGNKVAGTDGVVPIMTLYPGVPTDLDYAAYVAVAEKLVARAGGVLPI